MSRIASSNADHGAVGVQLTGHRVRHSSGGPQGRARGAQLAAPDLSVEMRTAGSAYVVVMGGALRSTSLVALEVVIDQLSCLAFDQLILDVTELTAVDAAGTSLLVGLRRWARDRGGPLALVGASADLTTALA